MSATRAPVAVDAPSGLAIPRRIYLWINLGLGLTHVQLSYAWLGPDRLHSGRSYTVHLGWAPDWVWGWALVAGAVACLAGPWLHRWPATILRVLLGAGPLTALVSGFAAAQWQQISDGWGGIGLLMWPIAGHALIIFGRLHRETRRA